MMKAIGKVMLLGLVATLGCGVANVLNAAEPAAKPGATKSTASSLTGEVVAVDKGSKTITVDIDGRVFVFKLSRQITVRLNDKEVPIESLAPGQTVSLIARRNAQGNFEIVALNILPSEDQVVAAGAPRSGERAGPKQTGKTLPSHVYTLATPFRTEPNPDNLSGGLISPEQ